MKSNRNNIITIFNTVKRIENVIKREKIQSFKLNYAISRNIEHLEPEVNIIRKSMYSEKMNEIQLKQNELISLYCKKDDEGKFITVEQDGILNYDIMDDKMEEFKAGTDKINVEYEEDIKSYNIKINDFLNEEVEVKVYKIKESLLLDNLKDFPIEEIVNILPIIEEE